ncbi:hypothetical protein OG760_09900 [Streptomyces sp. NBC_00963]|uniref:hypothetical protein n=1 Tax=Streptomyces sp. NBC_00963 TaxID=2903697 RepID=UPI00386760B3|nr:hypothetical protein OG760_09900 [Streptomyces sp. NBC_00963]
MTGNGKIGVALVGGYLLGRTKKAKLAIGLGMFLAGKKMSLDPAQLGKMVAGSPVLSSLNSQVRKELVEATKSAATSALTKRASGLADSLHERALGLDEQSGRGSDDEEPEEDDGRERAAESEEDAPDEPAPRKRAAKSTSAKTSSAARGKASQGARKTSSPARRAASGTRRTASRTHAKNGGGRSE